MGDDCGKIAEILVCMETMQEQTVRCDPFSTRGAAAGFVGGTTGLLIMFFHGYPSSA